MKPTWENSEVETKEGSVVVKRFGHIYLSKDLYYSALCPDTFRKIFIKNKVPVCQKFRADGEKQSMLSPVVVDICKLREGGYDFFTLSFEEAVS